MSVRLCSIRTSAAMYIPDLNDFAEAAHKLFLENSNTRYVAKYRHKDGKLVLKVTDDKVTLKYRTDQAEDLKRIEKLNNLFIRHMTESLEKRRAGATQ